MDSPNLKRDAAGKFLLWFVWLIIVGTSAAIALLFLNSTLSGPDHATRIAKAADIDLTIAAGMAIPFMMSAYFMNNSKFAYGIVLALLMIPAALGFVLLFEW